MDLSYEDSLLRLVLRMPPAAAVKRAGTAGPHLPSPSSSSSSRPVHPVPLRAPPRGLAPTAD
jgi:hypothetical protein